METVNGKGSMIEISIKKVHQSAIIPQYAHGPEEDAGMDLHACVDSPVYLMPFVPMLINTGISIQLPPGFEAQVRPRGGLALKHGITVLNSPGTIDPGYRGQVGVILQWHGYRGNNSDPNGVAIEGFASRYVIQPGDRIAQLVIAQYSEVKFVLQEELNDSARGVGAYASTGLGRELNA